MFYLVFPCHNHVLLASFSNPKFSNMSKFISTNNYFQVSRQHCNYEINAIKLNFTIIKIIISTRNKRSCHLSSWTLQYMLRIYWFQIYQTHAASFEVTGPLYRPGTQIPFLGWDCAKYAYIGQNANG